ncbi:MAG TPA: hypothetical protein VFT47_07835 [Vicinamibacterales bacterium]|nr:hypothetical protein [Vicinamibacterales bacterium]
MADQVVGENRQISLLVDTRRDHFVAIDLDLSLDWLQQLFQGAKAIDALLLHGREFRAQLGIGPKLYTRIARFQSGLVYAGCRDKGAWADAAVEMGYADQSHMIAEFRQFSALTPAALASREWFHPFIERARDQASR